MADNYFNYMAKANNAGSANKNNTPAEEKKDKDIVLVQFLRSYTPYIKGEVAGFSKKHANKLIEAEIAEEFKK